MIDGKTLNEKLLKWLGFKKIKPPESDQSNSKDLRWIDPTGRKLSLPPHLATSLDAQSKWLYPKLAEAKLRIEFNKDFFFEEHEHGKYFWTIFKDYSIVGQGDDKDNPQLAFALAVEKYIDNLKEAR